MSRKHDLIVRIAIARQNADPNAPLPSEEEKRRLRRMTVAELQSLLSHELKAQGAPAPKPEPDEHSELYRIVWRSVQENGMHETRRAITACNYRGSIVDPVTQENLHLFRRYRNTVSDNPYRLIAEALQQPGYDRLDKANAARSYS